MAFTGKRPSEIFREQLRACRERKGWKQRHLAERLTELGDKVHQTAVAKIENGEKKVTLDQAIEIAAALDVSPLALFLPRDDDAGVCLAPSAAPQSSATVRAWITGEMPELTSELRVPPVDVAGTLSRDEVERLMQPEAGTEWGYRTLEGRPLTKSEALKRRNFYEDEVSEGERRIRRAPGVAHLLRDARFAAEAIADGEDPAIIRSYLDRLTAEIERQQAELDHAERTRKG